MQEKRLQLSLKTRPCRESLKTLQNSCGFEGVTGKQSIKADALKSALKTLALGVGDPENVSARSHFVGG